MNRIKDWLVGIIAAFIALLLAVVGVQRRTIEKQRSQEARREKEEAKARVDDMARQVEAQAKARIEASERRHAAYENIRNGRRTHFEQD